MDFWMDYLMDCWIDGFLDSWNFENRIFKRALFGVFHQFLSTTLFGLGVYYRTTAWKRLFW